MKNFLFGSLSTTIFFLFLMTFFIILFFNKFDRIKKYANVIESFF